MKVVLYANEENEPASLSIQSVIDSFTDSTRLEVFRNSRDFSLRICRIPRKIDVAVLFALNHDQLSELVLLKDFLMDVRIILVLPDRDHQTVIKGHALTPNYTSYIDSNASDVAAVLNKMIASRNPRDEQKQIPMIS
jgi:hypothetical protein